jgi:hypothetical protein
MISEMLDEITGRNLVMKAVVVTEFGGPEEAAEAHQWMESRRSTGKILLTTGK